MKHYYPFLSAMLKKLHSFGAVFPRQFAPVQLSVMGSHMAWPLPSDASDKKQIQFTAAHTEHRSAATMHSGRYTSDSRMMQNCPDIVCTVDLSGRFVSINDACLHIWGYERSEVEGRHFSDFILFTDLQKTEKAGYDMIHGNGRSGFENRYVSKSGRIIPMLWSVSWSAEDQLIYSVGRDASEMKSAEAALQEGEQKYRSLFDQNPNAVFSMDMQGHFTSANEKVAEMLGCADSEVLGLSVTPFIAPEDTQRTYENFDRAKSGEKISYEIFMITATGERRYINIVNLPIIINGQITGVYGIAKDITEHQQNKEELQRLNESLELKIKERTCQLEESNKELEAFSYSVSHDLRAPLRIINGFSKLLSNEYGHKMEGDAQQFITAIVDNTKYMGRLIDDLLNLSRLGREAINTSLVDMTATVGVVIHEIRSEDPSIHADIKINELATCICDQALIRQVWINLVANAIKYSRKKAKPEIEIGSYEKGSDTVYYIKDNGAGFDMKFAAKLFGVFIRLHDRSDFDGTGVGLALVHRIITRHGGKVWANGKVDEGAVFYFSLPSAHKSV